MTGEQRRQHMMQVIMESEKPISASMLAKQYGVSRQVVVQDVALIRAAGYEIMATNRGYIMNAPKVCSRIFLVKHSDEQMEDELCSIVDLGGKVVDVMVKHEVYGQMKAPLNIASRRQVKAFMDEIHNGSSSPLKHITSDYHYHRIEADSDETLNLIEQMLKEKQYFIRLADGE